MKVLKPSEFAERIGVSVYTLRRWDNEGTLPAKRTPRGRRFYTESDVDSYFTAAHNYRNTVHKPESEV